jgi:hypothetical protein
MGKNASAFLKGATGGYQSLSKDEKEGADSILLGSLIGMGMGAGGQVIQNKRDRSYLRDYKNGDFGENTALMSVASEALMLVEFSD